MKKRIYTYTVLFEKAEEGGYFAYVPSLPGCVSQGETFEEAKENIKDAIGGYLALLKEDGDPIPVEQEDRISATLSIPLAV